MQIGALVQQLRMRKEAPLHVGVGEAYALQFLFQAYRLSLQLFHLLTLEKNEPVLCMQVTGAVLLLREKRKRLRGLLPR